ncbi:MAG: hypothetical protein H6709_24010 [Kofleriaceae bacterium]|nr:hypothetical protein [Kofleriaceae bacterium]
MLEDRRLLQGAEAVLDRDREVAAVAGPPQHAAGVRGGLGAGRRAGAAVGGGRRVVQRVHQQLVDDALDLGDHRAAGADLAGVGGDLGHRLALLLVAADLELADLDAPREVLLEPEDVTRQELHRGHDDLGVVGIVGVRDQVIDALAVQQLDDVVVLERVADDDQPGAAGQGVEILALEGAARDLIEDQQRDVAGIGAVDAVVELDLRSRGTERAPQRPTQRQAPGDADGARYDSRGHQASG